MKRTAATAGILFFALTVIGPLVWVLLTSFKTGAEIFASPWSLPKSAHWANYANAWNEAGIGHYFANSAIVTGFTLLALLPAGAMAAYIFARYPFAGSKSLFGAFLGGMMFPNFLVIVPLFFLLKNLHLLDTKTGLVLVYVAYLLSFTIFVLTGFFQTLLNELSHAAMIDGCGHTGTIWTSIHTLANPGSIVSGIFKAI